MSVLIVPSLILSLTSSSSDSVSLMVDVNDQANCDGVDGLTITATIADGGNIIASEYAAFADSTITFEESISPGDYTCFVTVEDGYRPIETMQTPCASSASAGEYEMTFPAEY